MDMFVVIGCWLSKQYVVIWCVFCEDELWCVNVFYVYDLDIVVFYLFSEEYICYGQMIGQRVKVVGMVNGQLKIVVLICGVQFKGEICCLSGDEEV